MSTKETNVPQKCADEWLQIEQLADEKVVLANRIVDLLTKACGRLDVDLGRILQPGAADFQPAANEPPSSMLFSRNPGIDDMHKGLRGALGTPDGSPPHVVQSGPPLKRASRCCACCRVLTLCRPQVDAHGIRPGLTVTQRTCTA